VVGEVSRDGVELDEVGVELSAEVPAGVRAVVGGVQQSEPETGHRV